MAPRGSVAVGVDGGRPPVRSLMVTRGQKQGNPVRARQFPGRDVRRMRLGILIDNDNLF